MKFKIGETVEVVHEVAFFMKELLHKHGIIKGYLRYKDGDEMYLVDFSYIKDSLDNDTASSLHKGDVKYLKTQSSVEVLEGEELVNHTGRWYSPSELCKVNNNSTFKLKGCGIK